FNASKAVALDFAGNSSPSHGECCSRELSTRFSLRIARSVTPPRRCLPPNFRVIVMSCLTDFGSALVDGFALLSYFALFAQLILFVACGLLPRLRALPSNSRKPAGARLDRALWFAHSFLFLLGFVGRQSDR
ncbi:hypothetical protein, partial [Ruminococcus sp.]|uniref:hypothetical protein n=1 Tax=Ruminococcus sp. TaxID=41978 RepID=UPI0025F03AE2